MGLANDQLVLNRLKSFHRVSCTRKPLQNAKKKQTMDSGMIKGHRKNAKKLTITVPTYQ